MTVLSDLIEWGINLIISGIAFLGYGGIIFFMALESACIPIPSEVIMPLSGYLAYKGALDPVGAVLAGSLGSMLGSLAAYYAGLKLGRPFIVRYGRYIFMKEEDLERAERWFSRYGGKATLISRMVPVLRTFISLPAGIGRMEIKRFTVYSFVGSIPWCALLVYLGYVLGDSWRVIFDSYGHYVDYAVIAGILAIVLYLLYKRRRTPLKGAE
jgi:membrane protein DedA with SNARE-associated domain